MAFTILFCSSYGGIGTLIALNNFLFRCGMAKRPYFLLTSFDAGLLLVEHSRCTFLHGWKVA